MKNIKHIKSLMLILSILFFYQLNAQQNVTSVLDEILLNNQQLKIATKEVERMKLESTIGNLPADPEVEYGRLWGSPKSIGVREDFSISQSFEFPTVYSSRAKFSKIQQSMADKFYQKIKQDVISEALGLLVDLVYHSKRLTVVQNRLNDAQKANQMTSRLLEHGEVGALEKDKADLQLINIENTFHNCKTDIENIKQNLKVLNGNKPIQLSVYEYPEFLNLTKKIKSVFLTQAADYLLMKDELDLNEQEVRLRSSEYFPEFSVSYASESILDEKLNGIKASISIPLWNKRNTVKLAKISLSEKEDQMILFNQNKEADWEIIWTKYENQRARVNVMRGLMERVVPNKGLLLALDMGEISLMEFITESAFYYDSQDSFLELEKEMYMNAVELKKVELAL